MSWHGIDGHDRVVEQFRRAISRGRLASSFLFVGPEGIGKHAFAIRLAQALLCSASADENLDPCGKCSSCVQVEAETHPDVLQVAKPKDKSALPLELLIGDKEHRMRRGLCHDISLKPFMGGCRVAIIDDADSLNPEGANCLLKTLEEPPPHSVLILIGTSPAKQLPTIRSRCQIIRFQPLSTELVAELLLREGLAPDATTAQRWAERGAGSPRRAMELADDDLWDFRGRLYKQLAQPTLDGVRLAKALAAFVEEAGKAPSARRARVRAVIGMTTGFYRQLLRSLGGADSNADVETIQATDAAAQNWPGDLEAAAACMDRCLEAAEQVDRNANQATLLECWLDDLSRLMGGSLV